MEDADETLDERITIRMTKAEREGLKSLAGEIREELARQGIRIKANENSALRYLLNKELAARAARRG